MLDRAEILAKLDGTALMTMPSLTADLLEQVLTRNPFIDNRINAPSEEDVDVPGLHAKAFESLSELAQEALVSRRGIGAILWGEAGIGKSHLLSRLGRWAREKERACLVYLHNLQASPGNLPRVLLRSVVGYLLWTESSSYRTAPLFRMIGAAIRGSLSGATGFQTWPAVRQSLLRALEGDVNRPADAGLADQTVLEVLFRFYRSILRAGQGRESGITAALAARWLRGDGLTPEQATELGLPPGRHPDHPVIVEDAQQIKQILSAMTRLAAACNQPFLLCFDQVDNLDVEQASALSRFLEALIDSARNLLVITTGIQATLADWHQRRIIQESAWDRMAQVPHSLQKLTPATARQLIEKRLQHFFEPFEDLPQLHHRRTEDALFPLGTRWLEKQLQEVVEVRPREVINIAREGWHREQQWLRHDGGDRWLSGWKQRITSDEGLVPPVRLDAVDLNSIIDQAVRQGMEEHTRATRGLPPDRESLAEVLAQLMEECRQHSPGSPLLRIERPLPGTDGSSSPYDLLLNHRTLEKQDVLTGLVLATGASANVLTPMLAKLRNDLSPPNRVLLVTGEEGPVLSSKGQEHLKVLLERPGCQLQVLPTPTVDMVTLDALHAVWNLARSEDLDAILPDGRPRLVTPDEVIASHIRNGRLSNSTLLQAALVPGASVIEVEQTSETREIKAKRQTDPEIVLQNKAQELEVEEFVEE
jgi:hypothetical protein